MQTADLALQRNKYKHLSDEEWRWYLQQEEGRARTADKLPTFAAIKDWWYPVRLSCEQCSSEATARYKVSIVESRKSKVESKEVERLLEYLHTEFPEIVSLLYVENLKFNDTIGDQEVKVYFGQDHIFEEMEGLQFKVGPKSFYQTNTGQAHELYKVAREFAFEAISNLPSVIGDKPLVYDLYTGTGTIANFVARQARQVIGIEYVPEAIEDAKVNSEINNIGNTLFFAGDMKDILNDAFVAEHGRPDVIITDPPRAGMHEDVVNVILNAEPERIVYVSCNPATQARDLQLLDAKYRVAKIQPVDMFPHTQHVENVVQLVLKIKN